MKLGRKCMYNNILLLYTLNALLSPAGLVFDDHCLFLHVCLRVCDGGGNEED